MSIERKALIGVSILLVAIAVLAWRSIWVQHDELLKADQAVAVRNEQIKTLQGNIATRDAADAAQQADAVKAQAAVKTSADAVKVITKLVQVPGAPIDIPQSTVAQKEGISEDVREKLPDSPDYVVQTAAAAEATAKKLIQCEADQKSLQSCKADKADLLNMFGLQTSNATDYHNVAKGGRTAKVVGKVAACAGMSGGGAALGYLVQKNDWKGPAIGAVAGSIGCHFVF